MNKYYLIGSACTTSCDRDVDSLWVPHSRSDFRSSLTSEGETEVESVAQKWLQRGGEI